MKCPSCPGPAESLVSVETPEGVEADWCPVCGGVWLDRGELEILCADAEEADRLLRAPEPAPGVRHPRRHCPICSARMSVVRAPWDREIPLDECPRRHGLWFDRGELERTLAAAGRIPDFLGSIFIKKEE